MEYVMKDLGYPRTPTSAKYRVTMPDGSLWDVPVQVIVDSRDEFYENKLDTIACVRAGDLDTYDIEDWASSDMNWTDVMNYAVKVDAPPPAVDYQEGWVNGEKTIVGDL